METVQAYLTRLKGLLETPLFKLGDVQLTLLSVVYFLVLVVLLFYLSGKIRKWLVVKLLERRGVDVGVREATGTIVRYVVVFVGLVVILQLIGINLTTLNILTGAVGIGVGFGLQNIANNFISGIIILFEQPVKIGDRIAVGDIEGDVVRIGARSTTVLTNDNINIIIPNSKFITENVVNWTHNKRLVRFKIPVSVGYSSDVRKVEALLLEAAKEISDVLETPPPVVRLMGFGDNGIDFELRAWTASLLHQKSKLVSDINFAIFDKLNANEISIPFPQRDVRIRSWDVMPKESQSEKSNQNETTTTPE